MMLPSHRDDIFKFLENFNVKKSATTDHLIAAVGDHSQESTSAESNKATMGIIKSVLLPHAETTYLKNYGRELFEDYV